MRNASARENDPTREKATRSVSPFLAWGDFHARSRFARSTISEEKWGTTRSLDVSLYSRRLDSDGQMKTSIEIRYVLEK